MFIFTITSMYVAIQVYLLIKSSRFLGSNLSGTHKNTAKIALYIFFFWISLPAFYMFIFGRPHGEMSWWMNYLGAYPFYIWTVSSIMLLGIFGTKDIIVGSFLGIRKITKILKTKLLKKTLKAPTSMKRRKFLQLASVGVAAAPIFSATYGVIYGASEYFINQIDLHYPNLAENLRGLKIAQLSDIHCGPYTSKEMIAKSVKIVNDESVDLILLTGDFVPMDAGYIHQCLDGLDGLKSNYGTYATLGNHEFWTDAPMITKAIETRGIPVFQNRGVTLDIHDEKLNLLGVDDSRWAIADIEQAMANLDPKNFNLLMSHQPQYWEIAREHGVDLTLSGHTHGGQVGIELLGIDINLGEFMSKYNKGLFTDNSSKLFVNTGIGFTGPPIRFNTPPEITIITLT